MDKKLKMLEEIIGYTFKNEHLLPHALTLSLIHISIMATI